VVDTNICVYSADPTDPVKQQKAQVFLAALSQRGEFTISTQVLSEYFRALTNPKKGQFTQTATAAATAVRQLASSVNRVYPITEGVVLRAVNAVDQYRLSIWDALIWAVAKENGETIIYTKDIPGVTSAVIDGITYINPL
jgi:predicted nucleic acid-binding protein